MSDVMQTIAYQELLAAKDAEIAELRAERDAAQVVCLRTIAERDMTQSLLDDWRQRVHHAEAERDEALECVGRLYSAAIDVVAVADRATLIFDTMKAALSATPERLRK